MTGRPALTVTFNNNSWHANSYMESFEMASYLLMRLFSSVFHKGEQFGF